jgi:hypothetical protein
MDLSELIAESHGEAAADAYRAFQRCAMPAAKYSDRKKSKSFNG